MKNSFERFSKYSISKNNTLSLNGGALGGNEVTCSGCSISQVCEHGCKDVECGNSSLKAQTCAAKKQGLPPTNPPTF